MFNLREISSVAPAADIAMGLILIAVAIAIANYLVISKLNRHASRADSLLLVASGAGVIALIVVLSVQPAAVFAAVTQYIVAFSAVALVVAGVSFGWGSAIARVATGAACMTLALVVANLLAYGPR